MNTFTNIFLAAFFFFFATAFLLGVKRKNNPFGLAKWFLPLGVFVWIDSVVFGLFFAITSLLCLFFQQWILFLLIVSVFWTIRAIGEQVYWFLEQFAHTHRNAPHTLWPTRWFKGEETWIVMQTTWQCVTVIGVISSVWLFFKFLLP